VKNEKSDVSLREDNRSLVQQVSKLERNLSDIQNSTKTIKHHAPQTFLKFYHHYSTDQRKTINRSDSPSLENEIPLDPTRV